MARLLLLVVAGMIFAAHASIIPGVSYFLKLDYLTKLVKLYACFHELKELCYNTFFCFLISLCQPLMYYQQKQKQNSIFYHTFFLKCFISWASLHGIFLIGRGPFKIKNCDHVQPHLCTDLKTLLNSKVTQHLQCSKSIQSAYQC